MTEPRYKENIFMRLSRLLTKIVLLNLLFFQHTSAWFGFFSKKAHEEVIQKEFPLTADGTVVIKNTVGTIVVNEWKQENIKIVATKKATKEEFLPMAEVKIKATEKKILIITKEKKEAQGKVEVNYKLLVPEAATVNVTTEKGGIFINNLRGQAKAQTKEGNIEIANVQGAIVTSADYGSITVCNSCQDVRAHTLKGDITIEEATKTIVARAKKGKICTTCKNACQLDTVCLSTESGHITLSLPEEVNAELLAHTKKGRISSQHEITLKPRTTTLNKKTFARMRKEVDGTLGTGDASIKLTAGSGNIKISKPAA